MHAGHSVYSVVSLKNGGVPTKPKKRPKKQSKQWLRTLFKYRIINEMYGKEK
jgi:hypothetical protein